MLPVIVNVDVPVFMFITFAATATISPTMFIFALPCVRIAEPSRVSPLDETSPRISTVVLPAICIVAKLLPLPPDAIDPDIFNEPDDEENIALLVVPPPNVKLLHRTLPVIVNEDPCTILTATMKLLPPVQIFPIIVDELDPVHLITYSLVAAIP